MVVGINGNYPGEGIAGKHVSGRIPSGGGGDSGGGGRGGLVLFLLFLVALVGGVLAANYFGLLK